MCRASLANVLFAPRISPVLLAELERLASSPLSAAEITRRVGAKAATTGLPRPSYERVRVLVRRARARTLRGVSLELAIGLRLAAELPRALRPAVPRIRLGRPRARSPS